MPKLLLHICCGPCATTVIERLRDDWDITGYFYNPNIYPDDECRCRLKAAYTATEHSGIKLIEGAYDTPACFEAVRGLEDEPENGARCLVCYRLRLAETARLAAAEEYNTFASTLTLGPSKKASVINPIGEEEAKRYGVRFLLGDWKKKDGFKRSCELSCELNIYRQDYCGCLFSKR